MGRSADALKIGLLPVRESLGLEPLAAEARNNRILGKRVGRGKEELYNNVFIPLLNIWYVQSCLVKGNKYILDTLGQSPFVLKSFSLEMTPKKDSVEEESLDGHADRMYLSSSTLADWNRDVHVIQDETIGGFSWNQCGIGSES